MITTRGFNATLISFLILLMVTLGFFSSGYSNEGLVLKKMSEQIQPAPGYQQTKVGTKESSTKRIMIERIVVLLTSSHQIFPKNLYFSEEYPQTLPTCVAGQIYSQLTCSSLSIS